MLDSGRLTDIGAVRNELEQLLLSLSDPAPLQSQPSEPAGKKQDSPTPFVEKLKNLWRSSRERYASYAANIGPESKESGLSRIVSEGMRLLTFLAFEGLVVLLLRYGPFEHYRPVIEPLLVRIALVLVCLFGLDSAMLFIVQFLSHLKRQQLGAGGLTAATTILVAFGWGSQQYFMPLGVNASSPKAHGQHAAVTSHPDDPTKTTASLFLASPTRGLADGAPAVPPSLIWKASDVEVMIGVFIAVQKGVTYEWELDNNGHREIMDVPDDGYAWIPMHRSQLTDKMHRLVIHRSAPTERAPDVYRFLTTNVR
jgi:hypothetical protein